MGVAQHILLLRLLVRIFKLWWFFRLGQAIDDGSYLGVIWPWRFHCFGLTGFDAFANSIYLVFQLPGARYIFHDEIAAVQVNKDGSIAQYEAPECIQVDAHLHHLFKGYCLAFRFKYAT